MKFLHRLLLVRHGQAAGNRQGVFLGRRDDQLTDTGCEQAAAVARLIRDERIDLAVTSPLKRAWETAHILCDGREIVPQAESRLMEQDYGAWDGRTFGEVQEVFADDFQEWLGGDPAFPPTGGETLASVAERVCAAYADHAEAIPEGGTLLLIAHAGALQALICHLLRVPYRNQWPFMLQPGSLTELQIWDYGGRMTRMSVR